MHQSGDYRDSLEQLVETDQNRNSVMDCEQPKAKFPNRRFET